jgi:pimeloyl-ACP methyl ester carboxylesterase
MNNYLWDENSVRYQLINSVANKNSVYNWLFFPGGPGADSSYLFDIGKELTLPGNTWLIDLPNNGSNHTSEAYDFDQWFDLLLHTVRRFQNPVLVGQSFGGMFPLLFPELEQLLKGFVILSGAPTLWHEEASRVAKEKQKPSYAEPLQIFVENPNPETFKQAMIIGGTEDCMTPPTLFLSDKRFIRDNISFVIIENAGHTPWLENMISVKQAFADYMQKLMIV